LIEQGFHLLEYLQDANSPSPLKDLAAGAGMSPSTAHFCLSRYGDRQQRLDELSADPGIRSQLVDLQLPT
jgi:IclR helix-turn-helix domain